MSSQKAALKAAKAALDAHKDNEAIEHINKILSIDPRNYHAYVDKPDGFHQVAKLMLVAIVEMFFLA